MRILALETTDKIGSVAAIADDNPLAELMLDHGQRSAQSLAPRRRIPCLGKSAGCRPTFSWSPFPSGRAPSPDCGSA